MKFNKNIALFIFMVLPVYSQASVAQLKLLIPDAIQEEQTFEKGARDLFDQAEKIREQLKDDSGNMLADYKATIFGMKNPMIQTTYATLKLQTRRHPGAAQEFVKKAVSPYYTAGFISFIAGTSLLATSLVSHDKKTLWTGSLLCLATSLGCYYKSRSDIITLRNNIIQAPLVEDVETSEDKAYQKK